jgi:hypothetical protein
MILTKDQRCKDGDRQKFDQKDGKTGAGDWFYFFPLRVYKGCGQEDGVR